MRQETRSKSKLKQRGDAHHEGFQNTACKKVLSSYQQYPLFLVPTKAQPVTWHPVWRSDRLKVTLSPTPRGPACTPSSLSPLGPCWLPSAALKQKPKNVHGCRLAPLILCLGWKKKKRLEATEHQLLWCDCGWRRSVVMGQIIRFQIPCRDSKCNLLQLAAVALCVARGSSLTTLQKIMTRLKSQTTVLLKSHSSPSVKLKETCPQNLPLIPFKEDRKASEKPDWQPEFI